MKSGIYAVTNTASGKRYIGSTMHFENRWREHRRDLIGNKHHSRKLQNAWNKYGHNVFKFTILYECAPVKDVLLFYEQLWIDFEGIENLYNTQPSAYSSFGTKHTDEFKKRLRDINGGYSITAIDLLQGTHVIYDSKSHACRETGVEWGQLKRAMRNKISSHGFLFIKSTENINDAIDEYRNKLRANVRNISKSIYQLDIDGKIICKWDSMADVERKLKFSHSKISMCCTGKIKSAYGFKWKFVE